MTASPHPERRERNDVAGMFDRIAPAYDRLNRLLSWGQDRRWRRRAAGCLQLPAGARVLDLAVGTGDLLIQTLRSHPQLQDAVGVDLSERMLVHCREKLTRYNLAARATLQIGDALALPFADRSFDAVTMAFGIRNTADRCAALREMVRVLKPGGQAVILEFALPRSPWLRWVYLAYLRSVVPLVGGILSGRPSAYRYLNRTIEGFHSPGSFRALMLESGFARVDIVPLSWGTVCIYDGTLGDAAWPSRN